MSEGVDLAHLERTLRSLDTGPPAASDLDALAATARGLVANGRGILAADESNSTVEKRLAALGVDGDVEARRSFRQWLLTSPGLSRHVSGVILYDETFWQSTDEGRCFPDALTAAGIAPGIKADTGTKPLAGHPGEEVTAGLDGLRDRLHAYAAAGARFAKWRAVIRIGHGRPSRACIEANTHAMARYAALCQEAGVVPMVEPEVVMDGAHGLLENEVVTTDVLRSLYRQLTEQEVRLDGTILKVNMIVPGFDSSEDVTAEDVAVATVRCLSHGVPAAVPGVAFLSGGQSASDATERLDAMNRLGPHPWSLTFSYARALQQPALDAWAGDASKVQAGQEALVQQARRNALASAGAYDPSFDHLEPVAVDT